MFMRLDTAIQKLIDWWITVRIWVEYELNMSCSLGYPNKYPKQSLKGTFAKYFHEKGMINLSF